METILVVDDERDIVSALNIYLRAEGWQTVCAYSGKEALETIVVATSQAEFLVDDGLELFKFLI